MVTKAKLDAAWNKHFTTETSASLTRYHRLAAQYHAERHHKRLAAAYRKPYRKSPRRRAGSYLEALARQNQW